MDAILKLLADIGRAFLKRITRAPAPPPPDPIEPGFDEIRDEETDALAKKRMDEEANAAREKLDTKPEA